MSKNIYCVGKIKGNEAIMNVAVNSNDIPTPSKSAKRVDIVSIKMVKESSILYKNRKISSPNDAYILFKEFLENSDREVLIVCSLDTKGHPSLIVATGEDFIGGVSSTARCMKIPIKRDDVYLKKLTHKQRTPNLVPTAAYYYIKHLSKIMDTLPDLFKNEFINYRDKYKNDKAHGRSAENIAWLILSYKLYLNYGYSLGYFGIEKMKDKLSEAEQIFIMLVDTQSQETESEDPVTMFLQAINELILSKQVHIEKIGTNSRNKNTMGWEDNEFYYLIPQSTYNNVMSFWKKQNKIFPHSSKTINEMLQEKNIIEVETSENEFGKTIFSGWLLS
jgi:hypothetical protein